MSKDKELSAIRKKKEEELRKMAANPKEIMKMPGEIIYVNSLEHFNNLIEKYKDQVMVMDCWAEWCGPCKMFGPIFKDAQKKWGNEFIFLKLNTDSVPEIAQGLGITGIPSTSFIKGKKEVHRQVGSLRKNQFDELLGKVKVALEQQG
ncbi:MAG: thioredoxin family protein [Promethearchaeota archaeon]